MGRKRQYEQTGANIVRTPQQKTALRALTKARAHLELLHRKGQLQWRCDDPFGADFVTRGRHEFVLVHSLLYEDELLIVTDSFQYAAPGKSPGMFIWAKHEEREALYVEPALQVLAAARLPALLSKVLRPTPEAAA